MSQLLPMTRQEREMNEKWWDAFRRAHGIGTTVSTKESANGG
jgi:hypothetical protein